MMIAKLKPSIAAAQVFLNVLDPSGTFTFQTFDDDKKRKNQSLARVFHGTLTQHQQVLVALQQQGAGIFVMINRGDGVVHSGQKTCRTAISVVAIRALFADLDGAPIAPVLAALQPDIVVETSPGRWHAYWLTNDCPLAEFRMRQQQIAAKFGADPKVFDLPRVLRLPGFFHQKDEPFMTRMIFPEVGP